MNVGDSESTEERKRDLVNIRVKEEVRKDASIQKRERNNEKTGRGTEGERTEAVFRSGGTTEDLMAAGEKRRRGGRK